MSGSFAGGTPCGAASREVPGRAVFLRWIQECLNANTTADEHPQPVGVVNDPSLIASAHQVRWSTNNYYSNHARHVGTLAMPLDASDDVPAAAGDPPAGTLRGFVANAIGAWLYVISHFESTDGAGGISVEGLGYGELSQRAMAFLLLAMSTTGVDDPGVYGPQAAAITSAYWDHEVMDGYLHMLQGSDTPAQKLVTSLVQSSSGTPFDGALVGATLVLFQRDITAAFSGVTFTVPSGTTRTYVTGLAPNGAYAVSSQPQGGGVAITVAPGGNTTADGGGVLGL